MNSISAQIVSCTHKKSVTPVQLITFKPLRYYSKETIGFDVKAPFASRPASGIDRVGFPSQTMGKKHKVL